MFLCMMVIHGYSKLVILIGFNQKSWLIQQEFLGSVWCMVVTWLRPQESAWFADLQAMFALRNHRNHPQSSSLLWYQSIVEAPHAASSSSLTRCLFARQRERRTACRPYQVAVIVDICRFSTFKPSWWGEKMQVGPQELTVSLGKYGKMMIISWNFGYPIFRPCSPLSFVMIH